MNIKGFTYGYGATRGDFRSEEGEKSQDLLYELFNNWVCLSVLNYQKAFYSTEIPFDYKRTPTDRDIEFFVKKAHDKGVKVCLKPMLNSDDDMWRAYIGFPDKNMDEKDVYWDDWFESYTAFILHYAELAEELGCEMICIGCEMLKTEHKFSHWENLIAKVRVAFSKKIVYNTNHGNEEGQSWFANLDYIGTSAYFPVGKLPEGEKQQDIYDKDYNNNGERKARMTLAWEGVRKRLNAISEKTGRKYIFMEIGCRSARTCGSMPWDFSHRELPWDEDEQADFYESCLEVFGHEKNFEGVFWWDWPTFTYNTREKAVKDIGFNIHLKKAEEVIKNWYRNN